MNWFDFLLPASFNGVPFYVDTTERAGGRQIVTHVFPLRDDPSVEDLGRLPRVFSVKAYVVGDLYMAERVLLETALENSSNIGTLIHPTYGVLNVWVGAIKSNESRDAGGFATLDIEFTLDGGAPSPLSITDTVSTLLAGLNSLVPYLQDAYIANVGATILSNAVAALVDNLLNGANSAFLQMPQATIAGVATSFSAAPTNSSATASAVMSAFQGAAANVVGAQPLPPTTIDPIAGITPYMVTPSDPSGGLAALASFGSTIANQPATALAELGEAQTSVITLIQGCALFAVISVYGQISWQSADQAAFAAEQLQPLLDVQVAAAADAGNFDLFRAWRAISAQAMTDLTQRAQALPSLASYNVSGPVSSLALAQYLYQDASQADFLAALNNVPHPIFMPPSGNFLQAKA